MNPINFYHLDFNDHTVAVSLSKDFFGEELHEKSNMNSHSGFELHFLASGKMKVFSGEEEMEINKWEYALIPPGMPHLVVSCPNMHSIRYRLQLRFEEKSENCRKEGLSKESAIISDFMLNERKGCLSGYSEDIYHCLKKIEYEVKMERIFSDQMVEQYLKIILIDILKTRYRYESVKTAKVFTLDENRSYIIDRFFNYNYLKSNVVKKDLADKLYVSTRQLERLLAKSYGLSFKEKLTVSRIEQAKFLLVNTRYSLKEVAAMSGFANAKYFNYVFKERTGYTPFKFREDNLQKFCGGKVV